MKHLRAGMYSANEGVSMNSNDSIEEGSISSWSGHLAFCACSVTLALLVHSFVLASADEQLNRDFRKPQMSLRAN